VKTRVAGSTLAAALLSIDKLTVTSPVGGLAKETVSPAPSLGVTEMLSGACA
jgi:hypothetical protein